MGHTWAVQKKIFTYTTMVMIGLNVGFAIFLKHPQSMILGLVFGTAIGMLNFRALAITLEKAAFMDPRKAQVYTASQYYIRYLINGVVIFVSIRADYLHIIGVIIGLVMIKCVILVTNLFNDLSFYKKIFARKEE
ncbi:ATP synthase subunit I [Inediibacterium massiliense]|uniref:ATP synthase subunit I n=1 Tax=Inediibacterium massiliense TaxID=1658111 RepID=UPI0006B582FB|nr:ATP synthase subunit I [Inediibacterium massiliense]